MSVKEDLQEKRMRFHMPWLRNQQVSVLPTSFTTCIKFVVTFVTFEEEKIEKKASQYELVAGRI